NLLAMLLDIRGNESTVAAHAALEIDTMVIGAHATDIRLDLCALRSEPRGLATGRFERLLGLLQAHGCLWGPTRPALFGLVIRAYRGGLQPFERLCGFADGLVCRPFFGGHGTGDGFDQLVRHMKQVR